MDVSSHSLATARHPHLRSTGRTPTRPTVLAPRPASARATVTLALGAYGLLDAVERLGGPWAGMVQTLLLALLAVGFLVAAQHSADHRLGWLLSGAVAVGLAIAAFSSAIDAAATPALPLAGAVVCLAIAVIVARGIQQRLQR
jgi:hypothetical protein